MQRNLVYHLYPVAANDAWRWNLRQLRQRLDQFDGVRTVAVALDRYTVELAEAKRELPGVDWIAFENDPRVSETASWTRLWETVRGEPGCTFRAHAKGVTPHEKQQQIKVIGYHSNHFGNVKESHRVEVSWKSVPGRADRAQVMRLWAQLMYEGNLDYWPLVEAALQHRPMCGVLKQTMKTLQPLLPQFKLWPKWQYLGSFYWVRNCDFFARDWQAIPQSYYGVELHPGFMFDRREAACLFWEAKYGRVTPMNRMEFVRDYLWRKFEGWKRHHDLPVLLPA